MSGKVEVLNVTSPQHVTRVDAAKFNAVKQAVMQVLPAEAPGMTPAELIAAVKPLLPQDIFPGGAKAGWWVKCVQLDAPRAQAPGAAVAGHGMMRLYLVPCTVAPTISPA